MKIIEGLPREAMKDEWVSIDLEMYRQEEAKLHTPHGYFACLSVSYGPDETYQFYDVHDLKKALKLIDNGLWVGQNLLYDLRQMRKFTPIKPRKVWDTMLVDRAMFSGWYTNFTLADLSRRWLGKPLPKGVVKEFATADAMTPEMKQYAATDAVTTLKVAVAQNQHIEDDEVEMTHYWEIDGPMIWVLLDTPPVHIDVDGWLKLAEKHKSLGEQIDASLGLNVNSHTQVKKAIEARIGQRISNTNQQDTLLPLISGLQSGGHEDMAAYIETIIFGRRYKKAASTYGKNWVEQFVEPGGWVHGDWFITGTETGRMTCKNPPLQTIPSKDLPEFRKLFKSSFDGGSMIIADVWQQEPTIMAWFSKDIALTEAIATGHDLHQETADDFGIGRRRGKAANLGIGYGMGPDTLAKRVGITRAAAVDGLRKRARRYPGVTQWSQNQMRRGRSLERVNTATGRPIWLNVYGQQWERNTINGPIQGTGADQLKTWAILVKLLANQAGLEFRVPLFEHDEIVADVEKGELKQYTKIMEEAGQLSGEKIIPGMPMKIEIGVGSDWSAKP